MEIQNLILGAGVGLATVYAFEKPMQSAELGAIGMIPVVLGVGLGGAYLVGGGEGMLGAAIAGVVNFIIQNARAKAVSASVLQQQTAYAQFSSQCPSGSGWLTCVNQKMQAAGYPPVQSVNGIVAPPM